MVLQSSFEYLSRYIIFIVIIIHIYIKTHIYIYTTILYISFVELVMIIIAIMKKFGEIFKIQAYHIPPFTPTELPLEGLILFIDALNLTFFVD